MVVAGRLRCSIARRIVDGYLIAAGDVERDREDGGDRARVSFGHRGVVDGEAGERIVGLQRGDAADYGRCRRLPHRCELVTIGRRRQWRTETNDDEDEPRDAIQRLGDEEEEERDGGARREDAQACERNLALQFGEDAGRFRPRQDLGGNEDRAKKQQPHCEQRKKNDQEDR